MNELLKVLGRVLWLLLRLVIYALTDTWIGKEDEKPALPTEPSGPAAPRPEPMRRAPPVIEAIPAEEAARLGRWLERIGASAETLRRDALGVSGGRVLRRAVDEAIVPELDRLSPRVASGRVDARGVDAISALDAAVTLLRASAEARRNRAYAARLADTEAIAASLVDPLYEHARATGIAVRERVFVGVTSLDARTMQLVGTHTALFPVVLDPAQAARPERLATLARTLARRVVDDVPGWVEGGRLRHRLAPQLFVPPPGGAYDPEMVRAALGVWWPELLADSLAVLWLGPAYASIFAGALSRPSTPLETRLAQLSGRWLSAAPPHVLRVYVAARALERLGFDKQATDLEAGFARAHPVPDVVLMPRADGSVVPIPGEFARGELDPLLDDLLDEPQPALSDEGVLDVPGLAFLHGEDAEARDAATAFLRGQPSSHDPRVLAAAALKASRERPEQAAAIMDALARSVRGAGTLEAIGEPASVAAPTAVRPQRLASLLRDKRAWREAAIVSAAFSSPRARSRP